MRTVDEARVALVVDHFDTLVEVVAIGVELSVLERTFGATQPEIQDVRRRQQRLCLDLLEQLRALICACDVETIH